MVSFKPTSAAAIPAPILVALECRPPRHVPSVSRSEAGVVPAHSAGQGEAERPALRAVEGRLGKPARDHGGR